jgi:hypothetical protein
MIRHGDVIVVNGTRLYVINVVHNNDDCTYVGGSFHGLDCVPTEFRHYYDHDRVTVE